MKKILFIVLLAFSITNAQAPTFNTPGEIKANNATITISHATPCVVDWNGDGKKDLLLGQFDGAKINYFENTGTDKVPVLKSPVFLKTGGVDIALTSG